MTSFIWDDICFMAFDSCTHEKIVCNGSVDKLRQVYAKVMGCAAAAGFGSDDLFAIQLAAEEALANAVKHGNGSDATKNVTIEYCLAEDKFELRVTDEGTGFKPDSIADPRSGSNLYKTGGRGVLLIKSYMDTAEYNAKGNSIYMVKYRSK